MQNTNPSSELSIDLAGNADSFSTPSEALLAVINHPKITHMRSANYKFTRDGEVNRVIREFRPSTDALSVLGQWRGQYPGRAFKVIDDTGDQLIVKLTFADSDKNASPQLLALEQEQGVQHEFVPDN